jgi:hypothetical protein
MVGHSDCETSRLMLRTLERLHRRRTRPVAVTAVLQDEPGYERVLTEELGLTLPLRFDGDPYPLTAPSAHRRAGHVSCWAPTAGCARMIEAFRRADVERLAALLGVPQPVFEPGESVPALRPG